MVTGEDKMEFGKYSEEGVGGREGKKVRVQYEKIRIGEQ